MIELLKPQGAEVLALDTGLDSTGPQASSLVQTSRKPGAYYDGTWHSWPIQGVMVHHQRLWVYGPGVTKAAAVPWDHPEDRSLRVRNFLQALSSVPEGLGGPWIALEDGGFLILPEYFNKLPAQGTFLRSWKALDSGWNTKPRDLCWRAAAMVWSILAGDLPYPGGDDEDSREKRRKIRLPQASLVFPGLSPQLAAFLDQGLDPQNPEAPMVPVWPVEDLKPWEKKPSPESTLWSLSQEKKLARSRWWRAHKVRVILGSLGISVPLLLALGILLGLLIPKTPDSRSPGEVVAAYYQGLNELKDRQMREVTTGHQDPEIAQDIEAAARFYIFSEVQQAQMGSSGILAPDRWASSGFPPLGTYQTLFGITELNIGPLQGSTINASYIRVYSWQEDLSPGKPGPRQWERTQVQDILSLAQTEQGWDILALDRKEFPLVTGGVP